MEFLEFIGEVLYMYFRINCLDNDSLALCVKLTSSVSYKIINTVMFVTYFKLNLNILILSDDHKKKYIYKSRKMW